MISFHRGKGPKARRSRSPAWAELHRHCFRVDSNCGKMLLWKITFTKKWQWKKVFREQREWKLKYRGIFILGNLSIHLHSYSQQGIEAPFPIDIFLKIPNFINQFSDLCVQRKQAYRSTASIVIIIPIYSILY